jgi:hypothetical protein
MLGRGVGLVELVERARERLLARDLGILRWHIETYGLSRDQAQFCEETYREIADSVCEDARNGYFFCPWFPDDLYYERELYERIEQVVDCPLWLEFQFAAGLASDIDSFLAVLESDQRTSALANDCRRELDLLLVLADLSEDAGLPLAAGEARHLYALVRTTL